MNRISLFQKLAIVFIAIGVFALTTCSDPPTRIKTLELTGKNLFTSKFRFGGDKGFCISSVSVPNTPFSAGSNEVMVGHDNFFVSGTFCDRLRALTFRGHVDFDVSQFDSIINANMVYDVLASAERTGDGTIGRTPPKSFANVLGLQTSPVDIFRLNFDSDAPLFDNGPSFDIAVTRQVQSWLDGSHVNEGFILAGPLPLPDHNDPHENNEVKLSWYGNFRLRISYNPAANPRAPQ